MPDEGPTVKQALRLIWWRRGSLVVPAMAASGLAGLATLALVLGPDVAFALLAAKGGTTNVATGAAGGALWTLLAGAVALDRRPDRAVLRAAYRRLASASDTGLVAVTFALHSRDGGRAKRALWRRRIWRIVFQPEVPDPERPSFEARISVWQRKRSGTLHRGRAPVEALRDEVHHLFAKRGISHDYVGGSDPAG